MRVVAGVYLADDVMVTGDVALAPGVNVWFGSVIRGDIARITLGENVNLQDLCIVHTEFGVPLEIESGVVTGHGAILHNRRIGADTLIGMGAKLLSGSEIGAESLIAAGAVVTEGKIIPPRSVVMGIPGKVVRSVSDAEVAYTRMLNARYQRIARQYAAGEIAWPFGRPQPEKRHGIA